MPRSFLGWGKSTQLGSSLGFALGAKLAAPDKLVIQFLGDTALGMCGMDLETAVRERIPILTVLVNNGLMGGYEKHIPLASEKYRSPLPKRRLLQSRRGAGRGSRAGHRAGGDHPGPPSRDRPHRLQR